MSIFENLPVDIGGKILSYLWIHEKLFVISKAYKEYLEHSSSFFYSSNKTNIEIPLSRYIYLTEIIIKLLRHKKYITKIDVNVEDLSNVRKYIFTTSDVVDDDFEIINHMKSLEELRINSLDPIFTFNRVDKNLSLKKLIVKATQFCDTICMGKMYTFIDKFQNLENLELSSNPNMIATVTGLENLKHLKILKLTNILIGTQIIGIKSLKTLIYNPMNNAYSINTELFVNLCTLILSNCTIKIFDPLYLKGPKNIILINVNIDNSVINDAIRNMKYLIKLKINGKTYL